MRNEVPLPDSETARLACGVPDGAAAPAHRLRRGEHRDGGPEGHHRDNREWRDDGANERGSRRNEARRFGSSARRKRHDRCG